MKIRFLLFFFEKSSLSTVISLRNFRTFPNSLHQNKNFLTMSSQGIEKIKIMHTKFVTLAVSLARLFSLNFFFSFCCCINHTPLSMQTWRKKKKNRKFFLEFYCVYINFFSFYGMFLFCHRRPQED